MDTLSKKLIYTLAGMFYGMMVSLPAVAEDIEIYTTAATASSITQANVLFVLDTSGSMAAAVIDREPYNPAANYSGGDACFDESRAYFLRHNSVSFLTTDRSGKTYAEYFCDGNSWLGGMTRSFSGSAVACSGANAALTNTGFFTGRFAKYRNNDWGNLAQQDHTALLECESDRGIHGENTGDTTVWANKNSPLAWSVSPGDEINWGSIGENRTLFSGHYLNYLINAPFTSRQRIDVMKEVMHNLMASVSGVNIGLMRFSQNGNGGMVVLPVADVGPVPDPAIGIVAGSHRDDFRNELNAMLPSGNTPLSEAFYEAAMYFQGKAVDYGLNSTAAGSSYPSVPASRSGNDYISPITNECQKNYVVILTDGYPVGDSISSAQRLRVGSDITSCNGNCLDEIAKSVGTNDQSPLNGDQVISTFTIGFANQNPLLQQTADESKAATGTGERFFSDNAISLADNLNNIIASVFETDTTFAAPAVSVNAFNRSTHLNDLYFTLFKPSTGNHWPGNLKKYKLKFEVDTSDKDGDGNTTEKLPFIADVNSNHAINDGTGFFDATAKSYWSDLVDGSSVIKGGAANEFESLSSGVRKVYTFTGTYSTINGVATPIAAEGELTATANRVENNNSAIDDITMLNIGSNPADKIPGTPRRETLLDWAAGFDVFDRFGAINNTTDMRPGMGSPLHSQPALVQYGGTPATPDLVAFVATNDGYLHAFDTDDGKELFSFIPQELLGNLNALMDDDTSDKIYGLDGDVVAWVNDINKDGTISGSDHVYLYVGMRRGGNNIYSVDVTDRNAPSLRWVIKGGVGDYAELGQTWSAVNVGKIKDGNTDKTVLIFGGGYDTDQDNASVTTVDDTGRAVFIADALSGQLLWSAGDGATFTQNMAEMDYSMPARITTLDMRGDGFIDRLYAVDMGGQMFRFDIDNNNTASLAGSIQGGRIARLSGSGVNNARRFYYPPDVALIAERGKSAYLALGITSGFRARPLNTDIHDRIYLIKDKDIYNTPASFVTLTESSLYDATLNLAGGDAANQAEKDAALVALAGTDGWYIKLDDQTGTNTWKGEKGLSEALFLDGALIVTTYMPPDGSVAVNVCGAASSGSGRVYYLGILDGTPAFNTPADVRSARHGSAGGLKKEGILPGARFMITEEGVPTLCIGTECLAAEGVQGVRKTFWHEVE